MKIARVQSCPICGQPAKRFGITLMCSDDNCGYGVMSDTWESTIEIWNKRTAEENPNDR